MKPILTNPTDDQLNAAFAEHVAGWHAEDAESGYRPGEDNSAWAPRFTHSADAVLPWLEKSPFDVVQTYSNTCCMWTVRLLGRFTSNKEFVGQSEDGPAKAGVIALLRAHGVEIIFG